METSASSPFRLRIFTLIAGFNNVGHLLVDG
jgi:hypothetical protein